MLLEFEIENDAAFADASTLSLTAGTLREIDEGHLKDVGDVGHTKALTSALILGKNGSGKSTFVGAMNFVARFVQNSAKESQQDEAISYIPNLLVEGWDDKPTRYRVAFSMKGVIYDFEFAHNADRIISERLVVADKSPRFRKMYERTWDEKTKQDVYSFGEALTGRRQLWQESTRSNALFLSTSVLLNSDDLKPAYDWLTRYFRTTQVAGGGVGGVTARMCLRDGSFSNRIVEFLQAMDINVEKIVVEEEDADLEFLSATFNPEFIKEINKTLGDKSSFNKRINVVFCKKKNDGTLVNIPLAAESTGTQALFNLAGPLFDTLKNGYCLLIDEINTSLHPIIVAFLVSLFTDDRHNKKRAQLIFTSHDTSVLSRRRMRRDQVWFIENHGNSARLVPLTEFSPRKGESLDKGYLGGRYGGVPNIAPALLTSMNWE